MHNVQTVSNVLYEQNEPHAHQVMRLRSETESSLDTTKEKPDLQPVIDRLRIIYLQHIDRNDELSTKIQDVAEKFISIDCSKISQLSDIIKMAQDCRNQFAQVLCNDFDQALLNEPVVIRNWKFEKWQLNDFINLDKYFGQRQVAISPFDKDPIPEILPKHELAEAIVELLKTIPEFPQETFTLPSPREEQALAANQADQHIIAFPFQTNGNGFLDSREVVNYTPENNFFVAYRRYQGYKKMASCTMQLKEKQAVLVELEIDIAARKLANTNYLQEIINQEAQRLLAYFEERQQATQAHLDEVEQARTEIAALKTKLDSTTSNLNKLRADLTTQEKKSAELQQQIYVEQAKYAALAQEIQAIRHRCKKRPWWKFW